MKVLFCNCRGISNLLIRSVLKKFCSLHKLDFLFIAKPWIYLEKFYISFWRQLDLKPFAINHRNHVIPNFWGACNVNLSPTLLSSPSRQISFSIPLDGEVLFVAIVYASTALGSHEMWGSSLPLRVSCKDFKSWSESCRLTHINTRGANFTWNNGRRASLCTGKWLDCSLYKENRMDFWDTISYCTLTWSHSNHHPLFLVAKKRETTFPFSFKFLKVWTLHLDCKILVATIWSRLVVGYPMFVLAQKLKVVKIEFKMWNK